MIFQSLQHTKLYHVINLTTITIEKDSSHIIRVLGQHKFNRGTWRKNRNDVIIMMSSILLQFIEHKVKHIYTGVGAENFGYTELFEICTFLHCLFSRAHQIRTLAILNSVSILNYSHPCIYHVSSKSILYVQRCNLKKGSQTHR